MEASTTAKTNNIGTSAHRALFFYRDGSVSRDKTHFMKDFVFTLLAWLLTLPFIIGSLVFALYNQEAVPVIYNPFQESLPLPLYVPVLGAIAFGFIFGSVMTWAAMGRLRKERRDQRKKIKTLEQQAASANQNNVARHNYAALPPTLKDNY